MGLMTTIATWRCGWAAERELQNLDANELRALAEDVGFSTDRLIGLTTRGAKGAEELPRLMRALGLVPEEVARTHPDVMRDMSVVCSGCVAASHCRNALDSGWAPVVQRYCPNTVTLKALLAEG
jgi:hypothetical protein